MLVALSSRRRIMSAAPVTICSRDISRLSGYNARHRIASAGGYYSRHRREIAMPMIELTAPAGALTEAGRKSVQRDLATLLLKWEGAPDNAFFRSVAWTYLH